MAMMVTVPTRGTDIKKNIRECIKKSTRKLRTVIYCSILLNIGLITYILHLQGKI